MLSERPVDVRFDKNDSSFSVNGRVFLDATSALDAYLDASFSSEGSAGLDSTAAVLTEDVLRRLAELEKWKQQNSDTVKVGEGRMASFRAALSPSEERDSFMAASKKPLADGSDSSTTPTIELIAKDPAVFPLEAQLRQKADSESNLASTSLKTTATLIDSQSVSANPTSGLVRSNSAGNSQKVRETSKTWTMPRQAPSWVDDLIANSGPLIDGHSVSSSSHPPPVLSSQQKPGQGLIELDVLNELMRAHRRQTRDSIKQVLSPLSSRGSPLATPSRPVPPQALKATNSSPVTSSGISRQLFSVASLPTAADSGNGPMETMKQMLFKMHSSMGELDEPAVATSLSSPTKPYGSTPLNRGQTTNSVGPVESNYSLQKAMEHLERLKSLIEPEGSDIAEATPRPVSDSSS